MSFEAAVMWLDENDVSAPAERQLFRDAVAILDGELRAILDEERKRDEARRN